MTASDAPIIVAGAGPVGTCLAIDAAMRGVPVIVIEMRDAGDPPDAKCNTVAARTMETFRRFGVAGDVRAAGLPDDYPTDTVYAASLAGPEITRIRMPSRNERSQPGFADSAWLSPESMVRVSQLYLEPVLRKKLLAMPNVRFMPRTELLSYEQDASGVSVHVRSDDNGEQTLRAEYLVGCDGGRSPVRKQMGVKLAGDAEIARTRTALIRSSAVKSLFGNRRLAWMSWIISDRVRGNVVAINGEDLWLVHRSLPRGEKDFDRLDADQSIRDALGVGRDFPFEIIKNEDWIGRRLVAEQFRDKRVFIAGDAAHLWVPFAGYGMNAGIADAVNLSWLLSSVIKGWAAPTIIDAYEAERLPITDQVSRYAMSKMEENIAAVGRGAPPKALRSRGPVGWLMRRVLGRKLFDINLPQMSPEGLNYGYYYMNSPIICADGETPPDYDMGSLTPSTAPGCRLPHFYHQDSSILDLLGPDYTLLKFKPSVDTGSLEAAAQKLGVPLKVLEVERPPLAAFRHALILVRSDQHVVWRSDDLPYDPQDLFRKLRGEGGVHGRAAA